MPQNSALFYVEHGFRECRLFHVEHPMFTVLMPECDPSHSGGVIGVNLVPSANLLEHNIRFYPTFTR